ncbi:MAG: hypothetical protein J0L83_03565 [Chitinophagales bacterium]|nr:hypothetical protein [Chitinophagales bacterium]
MKQFHSSIWAIIIFIGAAACNNNQPVTNRDDYKQFLKVTDNQLIQIDKEITFWTKKLEEDGSHFGAQTKLGGLYAKRFQYSGNIKEVHKADSFYNCANQLQKKYSSGIYRQLAANAITKHQFWQSKYFLDSAAQLGDNLSFTLLQQFDTQLELGNSYEAERILKRYPNANTFEVLIRKAKLSDAKGNLDEAIMLMEQALAMVTVENDKAAWLWVKSNLGDFYTHANRFAEAYQCYLNVLQVDTENYHCLKGIAWLAFSYEKNTTAAKEILLFLQQAHPVPDYDLLLAEIAAYEQNEKLNREYTASFINKVSAPEYGDMYNTYLFELLADEHTAQAMAIAQKEIQNRPTAQSYDLLSWAHYKQGNYKEALHIATSYVENKCFEPIAQYHLAVICKANGNNTKAKQLLKEVKTAFVELGPVFEQNFYNQNF